MSPKTSRQGDGGPKNSKHACPNNSANRSGEQADSRHTHRHRQLQKRVVTLEQKVIDLRLQLEERDQDLAAARAANRGLMTKLNASQRTG